MRDGEVRGRVVNFWAKIWPGAWAQEKVVMFVRGRDLANLKMSLRNFGRMPFLVSEPCADPRGDAATGRAILLRAARGVLLRFTGGGYLRASVRSRDGCGSGWG